MIQSQFKFRLPRTNCVTLSKLLSNAKAQFLSYQIIVCVLLIGVE